MTPRENLLNYFQGKEYEWFPSSGDRLNFGPQELHDYKGRAMVDQQNKLPREEFGGKGWFDIEWEFVPQVSGSISTKILFEDIEDWEKVLVWPDLDADDWEGIKARNAEYLNTDKMISATIFTGYFERLISFMGFENAIMTLADPDCEDAVNALFTKLTDLYIDYARRMHKYFNVEYFTVHDDWGSQRAPLFSPATQARMILPHLKRLYAAIHEMGCLCEQHSCGLIHEMVPNIIESGVDTWTGQNCCDKKMLVDKYCDKFKFGVAVNTGTDCSIEERIETIKSFMELYKGQNVWFWISRLMPADHARAVADFVRTVK